MFVDRVLLPQMRIRSDFIDVSMSVVGMLPMLAANPASAAALHMVRRSLEAPSL